MLEIDFSKMTPAQALELAKKASAYAALADGKALEAIYEKISDLADELQVSEKYIATLIARKFGIAMVEDTASAKVTKTRGPNRKNVARAALKEVGINFPNTGLTDEIVFEAYIKQFSQEKFDSEIMSIPASKTAKTAK